MFGAGGRDDCMCMASEERVRLVKGGELPPYAEMVNVNAPDRWIGFQPRPPR